MIPINGCEHIDIALATVVSWSIISAVDVTCTQTKMTKWIMARNTNANTRAKLRIRTYN